MAAGGWAGSAAQQRASCLLLQGVSRATIEGPMSDEANYGKRGELHHSGRPRGATSLYSSEVAGLRNTPGAKKFFRIKVVGG
eukprot:1956656-Prymnesium_polylepis.1